MLRAPLTEGRNVSELRNLPKNEGIRRIISKRAIETIHTNFV